MERVGRISAAVANLLNITEAAGAPILLGESNIEHMKSKHPEDFARYGSDIAQILCEPEYVGINSKDNSIEYVKEYIVNGEFVKVAVRVSASNRYFVRSLYVLNSRRVKNFIAKGTLKRLDNIE